MSDTIPSELTKNINLSPSTIETIDAAFLDYVENLNIFCNTFSGFSKIPVIWSSAERSYQLKNNKELRDKNGSLIPPIISIERINTVKDPNKKGSFQANVSPKHDRRIVNRVINQDKTSNFSNADSLRKNGQINFKTSKKNQKIVNTSLSIRIPIYITVEYKINITTNYQSQMNEAMQPFMARIAQNYFIIRKDEHKYECFMNPEFSQESNSDLQEEERRYKSAVTVKVLGYLIGEGDNQTDPIVIKQENAVEVKIPKENLIFQVPVKPSDIAQRFLSNNLAKETSSVAVTKKTFLIGNGVDSVYVVTHDLSSRDLYVSVRENYNTYDMVFPSISFLSINNISIDMGDIITNDSFLVTIIG
jgi:hypothetical protein